MEEAVNQLRDAEFRSTDLSLLLPENVGTKDLAHEKHSKAPEGAATGGATGALLGGALGWLVGIGAGAAVGGLAGALIGLGIPEYEAKRYEGLVKSGSILLSVHTDDHNWTRKAKAILERTGAEQIAATGEAKGDYANAERPGVRPT